VQAMNVKRWPLSNWIAILLAGALIVSVLQIHRGGSVHAKSRKIEVGMPRNQVEAVMGNPTGSIENEKSAAWSDDDGLFLVSFDNNSKVRHKQYNRKGNFMAKVRELIGIFLD
jgi:hypothetical protein